MTQTERQQLEELLEIADEEDSPLNSREEQFLRSLDPYNRLSPAQGEWFDRIVSAHLGG